MVVEGGGGGMVHCVCHAYKEWRGGKQILFLCVRTIWTTPKEGNVLFNDTLNTFYLPLYGVKHMVNDYSDSERGNPLPPDGLLFPISSKGYLMCIIPLTG